MIFPQTPNYVGQAPACPPPTGPLAFVVSLLGSVFPRSPSYETAPPVDPKVEIDVDGARPVDRDASCVSSLPGDGARRVVVHADQVPPPVRDLLRRLFTVND